MTYLRRVVYVACTGAVVVRRKRPESDTLGLPRHLWVDAIGKDPDDWKAARFEWAREHEWPPGKIGFLAFFQETRHAHKQASGSK